MEENFRTIIIDYKNIIFIIKILSTNFLLFLIQKILSFDHWSNDTKQNA